MKKRKFREIWRYLFFFSGLVKARLFREIKPLVVGLNVAGHCNLACRYCYGDYSKRQARDFTTGELLDLIAELHSMGARAIYLSGGEPLLRDDIGQIIGAIKDKNMLCFMNTNGLLVPDKIKYLKRLDSLAISIDGDEATNDINRGKGTFLKIIEAIKVARAEGLKVATNTVINLDNLDSIDTVISLAKNLGFTAEFNLPYEQSLGNKNNPTMRLGDENIRMVLKKLIKYKEQGAPISFSNAVRLYILKWPFSYDKKIIYDDLPASFKFKNCYMGRFMCLIDSDGFVYPCGQLIGKFPALNIREAGFKKAWDSLLKSRTCKACYSLCFNEFNQLFALSPDAVFSTALRFLKGIIKK
ncbi:MAG: hypothetical protein A3A98_02405 [Candidatus Staskawiczbacteria bacterium RIFCSPLOWO2_01_FULL_40_39]|nr:MAG: hypothetical protein A3A98_02405 [Candidatus Staskawiczbacteria bacterium RIFCSPLOWO2_01_FULL_40_39]